MQAFCKNCKFGGVVFKKMQQVPKIVERCYIYRKLGEVFFGRNYNKWQRKLSILD